MRDAFHLPKILMSEPFQRLELRCTCFFTISLLRLKSGTIPQRTITFIDILTYFFLFSPICIFNFGASALSRVTSSTPAGIYLLKVNNRNTRKRCKMCSKLKIKKTERRNWRRSGVFIVKFEHMSHPVPLFLLLILNR